MRRKKLFWQLFPLYLGTLVLSLAAVTWYAAHSWRQFYLEQLAGDLKVRAGLVEELVRDRFSLATASQLDQICKGLGRKTGTRLTLILSSGQVVGDSDHDPATMENHADRPEFQEALKGLAGVKTRFSYTLRETMMYVALPWQGPGSMQGVVRAALPATAIDQALHRTYLQIGAGGLAIALLATFLGLVGYRRLQRPLEEMERGAQRFARGDLSRKLPVPESEELASLAEALNNMADQLDDRIRTVLEQRREQEAVLASMTEGVMAVDHDQRLITLNRAGAQLLGVNLEEARRLTFPEVVKNPELLAFVARALASGQIQEGEILLGEEGERALQVHGTPWQDSRGKALGVVVVLNDVTRLRRLEKTRRDFVANAAHELKTPVTSIKGFLETLLEGALQEPENALRFLEIMARQADRLAAIIEDLLTLSRLEEDAERHRIFLTTGRLRQVMEDALEVCEPRATAKGIPLSLSCPEGLRAQINAPLLEQAVVNLVDNAIKYSPAGSPVQVEARQEGSEVLILVRDQGCGIAREHLSRLFERFYRVDPGRSRKIGGTGLGLAIVKHIAQAHGGRVTVASKPDQGSVFTLHLRPA